MREIFSCEIRRKKKGQKTRTRKTWGLKKGNQGDGRVVITTAMGSVNEWQQGNFEKVIATKKNKGGGG